MELSFNKNRILKKYTLEYGERTKIEGVTNEKESQKLDVEMEFNGNNISFFQLSEIRNKEGDLEQILEITENIFDDLKFQLDSSGKIEKITNLTDIIDKWNSTKTKYFADKKKQVEKDFIFQLSRVINNEQFLTELIKKYNVIPFLFIGLYNKSYSTVAPVRLETILYNIFPLTDIPVRIEIEGAMDEDGDKILDFVGKETHEFDRFEYFKTLEDKYPKLEGIGSDVFDLKIEGRYVYNADNTLSYFEVDIKISARGVVEYIQSYTLKDKTI